MFVFYLIWVNLIRCHQVLVFPYDNTAIIWNTFCPRKLIVLALKRTVSTALTVSVTLVNITDSTDTDI